MTQSIRIWTWQAIAGPNHGLGLFDMTRESYTPAALLKTMVGQHGCNLIPLKDPTSVDLK